MMRILFGLLVAGSVMSPAVTATADAVDINPLSAAERAVLSERAALERATWGGDALNPDSDGKVNRRDLAFALIAVGWRKTFK